ncbi:MAG TPA: DnaJ domain-containing protein [Syntrophales bacterium]|nr:DnaJ domain-containing protein [Syntrophales bacterium]
MNYPWQTDWKDYYKVLQVIPEAEPEVIDGAYKRLVTKYHPDNKKTGNAKKFRLIHEAHEILADPVKKKEYDNAYRNRFKGGDRHQIIAAGDKRDKDHGPIVTPTFQKKSDVQDTQSSKTFCNDSSCTGVIDENGFCSECKKAYIQEAQREMKERPDKRIIDEDI